MNLNRSRRRKKLHDLFTRLGGVILAAKSPAESRGLVVEPDQKAIGEFHRRVGNRTKNVKENAAQRAESAPR